MSALQTSRRALIGAAALAPFAAEAPAGTTVFQPSRSAWRTAVEEYLHHRAVSDALVGRGNRLEDGTFECDRFVDNYCGAMDRLIEDVRAPDLQALLYKMELAQERAEGFCDGCLPDHWKAIRADVVRFAAGGLA